MSTRKNVKALTGFGDETLTDLGGFTEDGTTGTTPDFEHVHQVDEELKAIESLPIPEDEKIVMAGELVEAEAAYLKSQADEEARHAVDAALDMAAGHLRQEIDEAAEIPADEEDRWERVPNRRMTRDAMRLLDCINPRRSRIRRRVHRIARKNGTWL